MNNTLAPFSCKHTPQVPELLTKLNCSLAISTYQAGKVVFISPKDEDSLVQLPRTFEKPMGIAKDEKNDRLAIATKDEIIILANSPQLALHYPNAPQKYDALYMPRATYHTGTLDIHDLSFGSDQRLFAVNTLFSCLVEIDAHYNFTPYWTPSFIDKLVSEDRCHLNGMALQNGLPKYITAFNQGNIAGSWRENITTSGVLMDVDTNETLLRNLAMPHSPRIYNNELYVLLSATGELIKVNKENQSYDVITKVDGFVRGMDLHHDYLFIGLSKLRKNSSTFAKLNFVDKAQEAGILIVHLPTGSIAGKITYSSSLDEIYDVQVLPNKLRPNILNTIKPNHKLGLMTPEETFWAIP
jgi:uncharacterized protein (TIGR03032 family)